MDESWLEECLECRQLQTIAVVICFTKRPLNSNLCKFIYILAIFNVPRTGPGRAKPAPRKKSERHKRQRIAFNPWLAWYQSHFIRNDQKYSITNVQAVINIRPCWAKPRPSSLHHKIDQTFPLFEQNGNNRA